MPAWPSTIRTPIAATVEVTSPQNVTRTDMDGGAPRARRRSRTAPHLARARLEFDQREMAIFEAWYRHEIDDGAAWFDMPWPCGVGTVIAQASFVEPWTYGLRHGAIFEVSISLAIRGLPVMSPVELAPLL